MFSTNRGRIALISVHGDPAIEIGGEGAGGQNVYVRQVGEALARLGWRVDMFTRQIAADQPTIVQHAPNCRTIRLQAGPLEYIGRDDLFPYLPEFVDRFLRFQHDERTIYPIVHTNYWLSSWVGIEICKRQLTKQVHTYHSIGAVKYQAVSTIPMIAKTRLETEKRCLETVDRVVATSPQEEEHMRTLISTQGSVDIIPCGTDTSNFGKIDRAAARQELGFSADDKIVLYVGRFDPRKGIETLVRAVGHEKLRDVPNLKLIIAGGSTPGQSDGLERDRIEGIVNQLGLAEKTIFAGRLDHTQLPAYYAAADVSVVPSHYEPFGLVTIEAMASGTPVVASDVGGLQYTVVSGETGFLMPPQDEVAFAGAIAQIVSSSQLRDQMGAAARDRVQREFSWDGVSEQLSDLYLMLIEELCNEFFSAPRPARRAKVKAAEAVAASAAVAAGTVAAVAAGAVATAAAGATVSV
ncbi:glycosyltransferase [Microcoleus sp. FACHB-1515]|uniref:glycosyltransferase n=1 Tax=Cyanophyceae TaxID=3028117 RepID=UPI001686F570|nr:glycosyltransferase [Microcoleus sp. FACHB-1515]MBD2088446.1 glycosyltransferase [Microcoleus sp. FACHB-1515]